MSISLMRKAIKEVYPGEKWQNKVSRMPDKQVLAIYTRMLGNGLLIKSYLKK